MADVTREVNKYLDKISLLQNQKDELRKSREALADKIKDHRRQHMKSVSNMTVIRPAILLPIQEKAESVSQNQDRRIARPVRTSGSQDNQPGQDLKKTAVSGILTEGSFRFRIMGGPCLPFPYPVPDNKVQVKSGEGQKMTPAGSVCDHFPFI